MSRGNKLPSVMLPGNTPGVLSPVIPVNESIKQPIAVVVKKNPLFYNDSTSPNALPTDYEDKKPIDASKFPLLRGFAD